MKTCAFKKDVLVAYCYGELDPEETKKLEEHLTVCKHCLSKTEMLKRTLVLIKQQKLKEIPSGLLDNYTHEIRERLNKERDVKSGVIPIFTERIAALIENLRFVFSRRAISAVVGVCIIVFIFAVIHYSKIDPVNLINQDIALLVQVGEDIDDIFLKSNDAGLAEEIDYSDTIILAQLDEEIELEEILDDLEILYELGEGEIGEDDIGILEDLEILDEVEMEPPIG